MKTTKSIAAYAMLLGTLLATDLVQTAHADPCVEVQNIVCRPIVKSSSRIANRISNDCVEVQNVVCGMRKNVLRHEIELAFQRGDFGLAFHLIDLLDD